MACDYRAWIFLHLRGKLSVTFLWSLLCCCVAFYTFADDSITCCTCLACIPGDYCVCRPLWCPPLLTGYGDASEKIKVPLITALGNHWTTTLYVIYTSPFASCVGFVTEGDSHQLFRRGIYFMHSQIDFYVLFAAERSKTSCPATFRADTYAQRQTRLLTPAEALCSHMVRALHLGVWNNPRKYLGGAPGVEGGYEPSPRWEAANVCCHQKGASGRHCHSGVFPAEANFLWVLPNLWGFPYLADPGKQRSQTGAHTRCWPTITWQLSAKSQSLLPEKNGIHFPDAFVTCMIISFKSLEKALQHEENVKEWPGMTHRLNQQQQNQEQKWKVGHFAKESIIEQHRLPETKSEK